jgi:hypothetical protein
MRFGIDEDMEPSTRGVLIPGGEKWSFVELRRGERTLAGDDRDATGSGPVDESCEDGVFGHKYRWLG